MKPLVIFYVLLFCLAYNLSASAQGGAREEKVDYSGVKFLAVHWVLSVSDHGKTIVLEDSSIWRICPHCVSSACRLLPGTLVEVVERGDTYRYPYCLRVSLNSHTTYPVNAMCVRDIGAYNQPPYAGQVTEKH
ncbi:MAG: hypothetical protein AAB393_14915 [Bacteroidota bacterium]